MSEPLSFEEEVAFEGIVMDLDAWSRAAVAREEREIKEKSWAKADGKVTVVASWRENRNVLNISRQGLGGLLVRLAEAPRPKSFR